MINYLKIINLAVVGSHSHRHTTRRRRRLIVNLFNLLSKIFALSPRSCMNHSDLMYTSCQCRRCYSMWMSSARAYWCCYKLGNISSSSSTIRNREWRHSINKVCIHVMCLGVDEATKIVCAQSMDSRVDVSGGKRGRRLVLASVWAMNGKLGGYWFHYGDSITMFRLTPFNQGTFFPLSWDYIVCFLLFFFGWLGAKWIDDDADDDE